MNGKAVGPCVSCPPPSLNGSGHEPCGMREIPTRRARGNLYCCLDPDVRPADSIARTRTVAWYAGIGLDWQRPEDFRNRRGGWGSVLCPMLLCGSGNFHAKSDVQLNRIDGGLIRGISSRAALFSVPEQCSGNEAPYSARPNTARRACPNVHFLGIATSNFDSVQPSLLPDYFDSSILLGLFC